MGTYVFVADQFGDQGAQRLHLGAAEQQHGLRLDRREHASAGRVPFGVVAVEQLGVGAAGDLGGQFPPQVEGVLEAQIERLAPDGQLSVRRVPCEQDATVPVVRELTRRVAERVRPQRGAAADVLAGDPLPRP